MYPVLFRLGGFEIPTHETFVLIGVGISLLVFRMATRDRSDSRALWTIAAGALVGGAVFAKASTAWRYVVGSEDPTMWGILIHGGKSVVGGLAGAYVGALIAKRLMGYRHKTGDVFAPAVALGIAVGRIGCLLTEQIGTPTTLPWGFTPPADLAAQIPNCPQCILGVPLHPSFLYEILFMFGLFVGLMALRGRIPVPGELFKILLLAYGVFRFVVEFARGNTVMALGLTGTQLFLAAMMPILAAYFIRQIHRGAYRARRSRLAEVTS